MDVDAFVVYDMMKSDGGEWKEALQNLADERTRLSKSKRGLMKVKFKSLCETDRQMIRLLGMIFGPFYKRSKNFQYIS